MKTKTIKKILSKKMEEWLSSITDEKVREACEKDLIVTGGSIASMLLREDVNDFDIYFRTKATVKIVSDYYVKKINEMYQNDISDSIILTVDSQNIPNQDYSDGEDDTKWGHFVESLKRTDEDRVKIYIPHIGYWRRGDAATKASVEEEVEENTFEPLYLTENAITLSDKVQLVIRFFGEADVIHENYDFVHATNYFTFADGLVLLPKALESLLTKELMYIGSRYPLTSVIRTKKFLQRNYSISAGTYLKILWQVAELDLKDPIVLQEQLVGVDIAYFSQLIDILKNVNPEKMTYGYISKIIDKVFSNDDIED